MNVYQTVNISTNIHNERIKTKYISLVNLLLDREKIRTQTVPTNSYWKYTTLRGNKKFPLIHVVEI